MTAGRFVLGAAGLLIAGAMLAGAVRAEQSAPAGAPPRARVDFTYQIRPLLSDRCFRCHGPDARARKAKLRLDQRDGALRTLDDGWAIVKPFDPERSELVRRIELVADDEDAMPPAEAHLSLTPADKALLRQWIAEGADYQPHWSLVPVREARAIAGALAAAPAPPRPTAKAGAGSRPIGPNPIDTFVRARLAGAGLDLTSLATPETLLRRLALNLTGLPPTPAEIDAFVADRSPGAWARVVDRYLAAPAYGERMAMDWLDLARYADTYGYQADVERDMSPWRDWVIGAFNDNLPYDQFLVQQLAGDLLPNATRGQRVATAFNRLHRQTNEGGSIEEEFRTEYVADRVNTFGTAMLGLTLECARCHDHKFDPITQRDYFSLFAFFNNIDESGLYSHFTNATPTPSLLLWPAQRAAQHRAAAARVAAAETRLETLSRAAHAAFRAWRGAGHAGPPTPVAHLAFDQVTGDTTPDSILTIAGGGAAVARLQDAPQLVPQATGAALRFSGDNAVSHPAVRAFRRTDPFSLSLRLKPTGVQDRAVVVHQSRAWTDAGSRGFELVLEHGRPFFALVHFWPGNAIAVRARAPLPVDAWSRLTVTYDGSSRAAGIRLYLDGAPIAADVVRDHLYKDITYDKAAGDNVAEQPPLTIGARFRDSGFRDGLIDDLQLFDLALTTLEVSAAASLEPRALSARLGGPSSPGAVLPALGGPAGAAAGRGEDSAADTASSFEHFFAREYPPAVTARAELQGLRVEESALVSSVPELMVMEEMPEPRPTRLLQRGAYDAPGERVSRDTPASLPPFPADQPRTRLGLARWLTRRDNPLAARVVVNRIWRLHFGRGLVASQEDFGSQGKLPTHPELLDWLAATFMDSGWNVKALHRLIATSDTFRQSSRASADALARDPDNRLLSRGPTLRLLAEQVRDVALAASGLLTRTVGGPSVRPYQPAGLWEQAGTGKTYTQDTGPALYRRSLYTFWRRTSPPPSMLAFDAMSREVCTARREVTTTPLQALVLLNDPQFVEAARVLAERLLKRFPHDAAARNREGFRVLTGRAPDATETGILARLFAEQRTLFDTDAAEATKLLETGDSVWDATLPRADFAAMTQVVSAIMNTDEFVVVR